MQGKLLPIQSSVAGHYNTSRMRRSCAKILWCCRSIQWQKHLLSLKDHQGDTALHLAVLESVQERVELLSLFAGHFLLLSLVKICSGPVTLGFCNHVVVLQTISSGKSIC